MVSKCPTDYCSIPNCKFAEDFPVETFKPHELNGEWISLEAMHEIYVWMPNPTDEQRKELFDGAVL